MRANPVSRYTFIAYQLIYKTWSEKKKFPYLPYIVSFFYLFEFSVLFGYNQTIIHVLFTNFLPTTSAGRK